MKRTLLLLLLLPFISNAQKIPAIDEAAKKAAKEKIDTYRQLVVNGDMSMADVAALYSEDPGSAKNGGLYNKIARGQFVPEFETIAFSIKPGDISEVFETQYGYHFLQVVERRGDEVDVRHVLVVPK